MDCFFAAVEVQLDPSLRGRPVVVGGTGDRGVVASASYEARIFGVRSAMPTAVARGLCPSAIFVPGHFDEYRRVSAALKDVLSTATPLIETVALDEAYLDLSGAHRLLGDSRTIAQRLREQVRVELGLECAVGVGRSKLIAKLASKAAKPVVRDGVVEPGAGIVAVDGAEELTFLHRHPVRALPGVGPRTAERLMRYGVSTVSDLAMVSVDSLVRLLGAANGRSLHELAWGRDRRPVIAERAARSIGHEETFEHDIHDAATMARRAREMAALVATRCRRAGVEGRTVTVKVRFSDFSSLSRSRTLDRAASTASAIGDAAVALLSSIPPGKGVRLVGVYCSSFGRGTSDVAARQVALDGEPKGATQLRLFSDTGQSDRVETAAEAIRERFGTSAIAVLAARQSGGLSGPAGPNRAR